ncbi:MAG: murein biosynthesis integral membrane protein MurJ [candidate division Zixibacteria bacterium]
MVKKTGFTISFSRVASGTFLSRLLGLVREQVFAHLFGASLAADAFFAAYRIPNLLRDLFAEGALSSAFVPVFKQEFQEKGKEPAFELAQVSFSVLTLVVSVVCIAGAILSPYLVKIIAPGFSDISGKAELTGQLTAYMFPFLLLVALAALAMSILNSLDKFGIPALAPAMFNIGVITAAFIICPYLERPIFGIAAGVLLGGTGQFLIQVPSLLKSGFRFRFKPQFNHHGLKRIAKLMSPMIGGLAAGRINIFVNTLLASLLAAGSVSYLTYAYRIMHLPLGIIAVALGTVALPKASALAAMNDEDGLIRVFYRAVHLCFFLVFPVAAFFIVAGDEIIGLLFEHGRFVQNDTYNTYRALKWFSVGLIGFAGVRVTAPIYYALKDAVNPMKFSIYAVLINLGANFIFIRLWDFAGLAAATALGGIVNFGLLVFYLPAKIKGIKISAVSVLFIKSVMAAALTGILLSNIKEIGWFIALGDSLFGRIEKISILLIIAAIGYLLVSFAFRNIPKLKDKAAIDKRENDVV